MSAEFGRWNDSDAARSHISDVTEPPVPRAKGPKPKQRFPLVRLTEISPNLHGRYLIKSLLQSSALHLVWGPPKCGKSFKVMDMAGHIACGKPYRGLRVRQGPVVYIVAEGIEGFRARALAWRRQHLAAGEDPPLYILGVRVDLVKDHPALIKAIREQVGTEIPALVVIDTLNRTFAGSESSDEDMTAYTNAADAVMGNFGCAVVVVHHCGHEASRPRGHSSLLGSVDVSIAVKNDKASKTITATVDFGKDMPEGFSIASKLMVVEIGTDEDGDPVNTCIIEPTEDAPASEGRPSAMKLSPGNQIALDALREAIAEHGIIPSASNHIPANVRTVNSDMWKRFAYARNTTSPTPHAKNKAFNDALKALQAKGRIGVWDNQVWAITA